MTIDNIDINATIKRVEGFIAEDKDLSAGTKSLLENLVLLITLMANRLNLNSTDSSKPPSSDPNRKKTNNKQLTRNLVDKKGAL